MITDGDQMAVQMVASKGSFFYFSGYTEGYFNADGEVVLPNQMGFFTRIATDFVTGSSDVWLASTAPTDWIVGALG